MVFFPHLPPTTASNTSSQHLAAASSGRRIVVGSATYNNNGADRLVQKTAQRVRALLLRLPHPGQERQLLQLPLQDSSAAHRLL